MAWGQAMVRKRKDSGDAAPNPDAKDENREPKIKSDKHTRPVIEGGEARTGAGCDDVRMGGGLHDGSILCYFN